MAGYQFIHVEAYSREASKQKEGGLSVRDVIAEAGREVGNCHHIEAAQPPEILHGSLDEAESSANEWAEQAQDDKGRKLRKDGHCLLAGVISIPDEMRADWESFSRSAVTFLKQKYGDRLKAVVAHHDESKKHLHFYTVPRFGEKFEAIHEGQKAAKTAKREGKLKGEQNKAYIEAMRAFQDDFSSKVGQRHGLTRLGPGRRRLSRAAWKAEQKQAESLNQVEKTARKRQEHYKSEGLKAGFAQAEIEAKKPVKRLANHAKGFLKGVYEGLLSPTQAEIDAKRALEEDDRRRHAEEARKEAAFKKREKELREAEEKRYNEEKKMREQAEDALDFVLKVGGPELLLAVQQASKEREQAPQEATLSLRKKMPPAFNK